jgi:hypothetical protein
MKFPDVRISELRITSVLRVNFPVVKEKHIFALKAELIAVRSGYVAITRRYSANGSAVL